MDIMTSPGNSTRLKTCSRAPAFFKKKTVQAAYFKRKPHHYKHHPCRNHRIDTRSATTIRNHKNAHKHDISKYYSVKPLGCNGKFTREVYNVICSRLEYAPSRHIPGEYVQALFNDMKLYPSKAQVSAMLQCARQLSRRNGTSYLTFGEFVFFVRVMHTNLQPHKPSKCTNNCEVFLGGSCNPTTWRTDTAIPELQKHGITYYNPQVSIWAPELVAQEHDAKQKASLLLYVVDSQTRSVAGMIEVSYLVAAGRCVVLVAYPYREGQTIMDEPITNSEYIDLVNGQTSLLALVKSQGIKVHNNLSSALQSTANILRNTSANNGMTAEEQITHKLRKLKEAFDSFDVDRTGEINLKDVLDAYHRLTNKQIDMHSLCNYLSTNIRDANNMRISFEQFCALVAEFSTDGCESFAPDDWISAPLQQRQCTTNNNTHPKPKPTNGELNLIDIFLGGSCETRTAWRENVIPLLKKQGITYYNPAIREIESNEIINGGSITNSISESKVLQWKRAMERSSVLLFYITSDTRSLTTMILAAHYIGLDRDVVLCVQQMPHEDLEIFNEKLTKQAIKDYNRGRVYLSDLAKRKQVPVFESITDAVQCAVERSRRR